MVALSQLDQERALFHLGFGNGQNVDEGDLHRFYQAAYELRSNYIHNRVIELLDYLDELYDLMNIGRNPAPTILDRFSGDMQRLVERTDLRDVNRVFRNHYLDKTDELAQILACTNYQQPWSKAFLHDSRYQTSYVRIENIGPADTSVSSRQIEYNVGGPAPMTFIALP